MKPIQTQAIITSVRARVDGSLGVGFTTPELTPMEKAVFMELQNLPIDLTITPKDSKEPPVRIDSELNTKTPSQRLRSVIYVYWEQLNHPEDKFETFYDKMMEKFISAIKDKLEQ